MSSPSSLGRSAGMLLLSPSLNPFAPSDPQESAWEKSWRAAVSEVLQMRDQERRRKLSAECSGDNDFKLGAG